MTPEEAKIKDRLEQVLQVIFCPTVGCWPLHGCHYECYNDDGLHVLEVWPTGFEEPEEHEGNGRGHEEICYEFAEFEFGDIFEEVPLEYLHFSQRRRVFDIGWKEDGREMGLRVHIVPVEVDLD